MTMTPVTKGRRWRVAVLDSDLPRMTKLVALAVQTYMLDDYGAQVAGWPDDRSTAAKVATMAGITADTFERHYHRLRDGGWFAIE